MYFCCYKLTGVFSSFAYNQGRGVVQSPKALSAYYLDIWFCACLFGEGGELLLSLVHFPVAVDYMAVLITQYFTNKISMFYTYITVVLSFLIFTLKILLA